MNYDFEIHIAVKVPKLLKIDPPIHVKNFLSAGPMTLILVPAGIRVANYLLSL